MNYTVVSYIVMSCFLPSFQPIVVWTILWLLTVVGTIFWLHFSLQWKELSWFNFIMQWFKLFSELISAYSIRTILLFDFSIRSIFFFLIFTFKYSSARLISIGINLIFKNYIYYFLNNSKQISTLVCQQLQLLYT